MSDPEICQDKSDRRRRIRERARAAGSAEPNGIDYVEVDEETQKIITVYFLNKAPRNVGLENVRITGGVRVRDISVTGVQLCEVSDPERDDCMRVFVSRPGDFSTYTLRLVNAHEGRPGHTPLEGFDPRYAQIDFSFKVSCPSDLDCAAVSTCHEEPPAEPEINYLAKDYASFRQLVLDRLSLVMPGWTERHVPDIGIALVELFAYVGDYLSYYQDAVATEAYLDTARQRISVRRHAALVDYRMHEGCNARAWVFVETDRDVTLDNPKDVYFITDYRDSFGAGARSLTRDDLRSVPPGDYEVFEPLPSETRRQPIHLYAAHNRISFYTWGDRECCLARGATSATLKDDWKEQPPPPPADPKQQQYPQQYQQQNQQQQYQQQYEQPPPPPRERVLRLKAGDVLIFEELTGPVTGVEADADKSHRHAVRLTRVEPRVDEIYDQPVVDIEWAVEDALPFTLCVSTVGQAPECRYLEDVSVARGNIILVDHGRTMPNEVFTVPAADEQPAGCIGPFEPRETTLRPGRFRPVLRHAPVTHSAPFPAPASVSNAQAEFLGGLMKRARTRVEQIRRRTQDGRPLSPEDLAELETIFGRDTLKRVGLVAAGTKAKQPPDPAEQDAALRLLLARFEEFLTKKSRRLRVLRERVLGGYVLTDGEREEIGEMFGPALAAGVEPNAPHTLGPAAVALAQDPREATARVVVRKRRRVAADTERPKQTYPENHYPRWTPQPDLLSSTARQRHFVAEIDNDGRAHLRFGDGELGRAPEANAVLQATYRTGNGAAGNVGADAITHVVFRKTKLSGVRLVARNPLPAVGGTEPEAMDDVKMFAPGAFRKVLQRAITPEDYAHFAERGRPREVQRAAASLRWAGSWYEMRTAVDPRGSSEIDDQLLAEITGSLHRYRRIGHDLATRAARFVPLDVAIQVCVLPHFLRGHVKAALQDVFSNRLLPGGRRGFFHPDNLTFGEPVYLSRLVAAAQAVEGVESARVLRLRRLDVAARERTPPNILFEETEEITEGVLPIGPFEVARLDSDPNFPEHGVLVLDVRGGR